MMVFNSLQNADVSYLDAILKPKGVLIPVPSAVLAPIPQEHLSLFCVENGVYQLPTTELIEWLSSYTRGRNAIELGAGNGVFGRALGIPMYDNKMQEWPEIKAHYQMLRQNTVQYGDDVITMDGMEAVKLTRPDVVIASWLTQIWKPEYEDGNMYGVDEEEMMEMVGTYIHIGNEKTHKTKAVLQNPKYEAQKIILPGVLFSRSMSANMNVIYLIRNATVTQKFEHRHTIAEVS